MPRKALFYWNILLLLLAFTQCSQCQPQVVESLLDWELTWEEAKPFSSPFSQEKLHKGLRCYVDSEKATYYLNPTGDCWRFTQDAPQGLVCDKIASFKRVTGSQSFCVFTAGSTQEQALYVCLVDRTHVKLIHYKEGNWVDLKRYALPKVLSGSSVKGAACSIHKEDGQVNGLIILAPQSGKGTLCTLEYDPVTEKLAVSPAWRGQYNITPDTAVEIAPDMLLSAARSGQTSMIDRLTKGDSTKSKLAPLSGNANHLDLFVLKVRGFMKKAVLAFYVKKNKKADIKFCTLEIKDSKMYVAKASYVTEQEEEHSHNNIDHRESLIIPFADAVYLITQPDNPVYYKGSFKKPSDQPKDNDDEKNASSKMDDESK